MILSLQILLPKKKKKITNNVTMNVISNTHSTSISACEVRGVKAGV